MISLEKRNSLKKGSTIQVTKGKYASLKHGKVHEVIDITKCDVKSSFNKCIGCTGYKVGFHDAQCGYCIFYCLRDEVDWDFDILLNESDFLL